jgi:hypothetical protein
MPVLAVMLVLGLANTAFAQLSCSVASTPVSRDTATGHTEVAGDLIFNCVGGGTATTAATITVDYGVVITNSTGYPTATPVSKPIAIVNTSGSLSGGGAPTISAVNNSTGQVVISVPAQAAPAAGSFTLTGVLVSLAGSGKTNLVATVSVSPGNNVLIVAGQNVATVITTILDGLRTPTLTTGTAPGLLLTTGIIIAPGFSVAVTENYIDMFRDQTQYNSGAATNGTQLQFTFTGIPTGVSLTGCTATATSGTPTLTLATLTSANNVAVVDWTVGAGPSLVAVDTVTLACAGITLGSSTTIPLTPGNIQVAVTLAPTGNALNSSGGVLTTGTTGQIPRYQSNPLPSPPLTVITISPAQTVFLIPFAVVNASGFDTGIALANTTADPFGGAATGSARAQNGTVTFTFFPQTGSSCSLTPSGTTVGTGFSAGGNIDSGRTISVLLSELLRAGTGCPTTFTGYIFAVANFTDGHGSAFVSDFRGFTSFTPVLLLPPPAIFPRSVGAIGVFETLTF